MVVLGIAIVQSPTRHLKRPATLSWSASVSSTVPMRSGKAARADIARYLNPASPDGCPTIVL